MSSSKKASLDGESEKEETRRGDNSREGGSGGWIGVRLSKVMMEQVKAIVNSHPEWAWRNPNDFVRDAVRRHMEYVRSQDRFNRQRVSSLPGKVNEIARAVLDDRLYEEFRKKMSNVLASVDAAREPELFIQTVKDILASYVGEELASRLVDRLYEEAGGENDGHKEI